MRYIPNSLEERESMLKDIGLSRIEQLFEQIPDELRLNEPLGIGEPVSELDLLEYFRDLASKDRVDYHSFLGAGAYSHFIPVVIDPLISRSEFFTAYTPYQPELSQGTLQYIFEFQTMTCQLMGMEVANASLYDGSTALAEAVLMAARITRRNKFLVARTVHPQYREVTSAYTRNLGTHIDELPYNRSGRIEVSSLPLDDEVAAIVVQSPNFFGCIEDLETLAEAAHKRGALLIVAITEALSLGALKPPGQRGADIVVAEAQSLGIPLGYGGPYCGLFATLEKHVRQMPGRLVGETVDHRGRRGYVLTLSTREQHIRRERATSNICTNQGLFALMVTIYLATMGKHGIQEAARQNLEKAHYAAAQIAKTSGFDIKFPAPFFNEFVVRTPGPAKDLAERLLDKKVIAGLPLEIYYPELSDSLLVCVTETARRQQIDNLISALADLDV